MSSPVVTTFPSLASLQQEIEQFISGSPQTINLSQVASSIPSLAPLGNIPGLNINLVSALTLVPPHASTHLVLSGNGSFHGQIVQVTMTFTLDTSNTANAVVEFTLDHGNFSLSMLDASLGSELDFLSLVNGYIVFATSAYPNFVPTQGPLKGTTLNLAQGLNFGAQLSFPPNKPASPMQANLATLLNDSTPLIYGSVAKGNVSISATLATIPFFRKMALSNPALTVQYVSKNLSAQISAGFVIPIPGTTTPLTITASINLSDASLKLVADMQTIVAIPAPYGLNGIVLRQLGFDAGLAETEGEPGIDLGASGTMSFSGDMGTAATDMNTFGFGANITPETLSVEPIYFYFYLGQTIDLKTLLNTIDPKIPDPAIATEIQVSQAQFYYVQPGGATDDNGDSLNAGLAMGGQISAFGFNMSCSLALGSPSIPSSASSSTAPSAAGYLIFENPISFPGSLLSVVESILPTASQTVTTKIKSLQSWMNTLAPGAPSPATPSSTELVLITGASANVGPSFAFNTSALSSPSQSSPGLSAGQLASEAMQVWILGANCLNVNGSLSTAGLVFDFQVKIGGALQTLTCTLNNAGLTVVSQSLVPFNVGGLATLFSGGINLGQLNFAGTISGSLSLTVGPEGGAFSLDIQLAMQNVPPQSLKIRFAATPTDFVDFAETLATQIKQQANTLFSSFLPDLEGWASAGIYAAASYVEGQAGDIATAVKTTGNDALSYAKSHWNSLDSNVSKSGKSLLDEIRSAFGISNSDAADAIQNALSDPNLLTPALNVQQFRTLAPLGRSSEGDALLLGISILGQPYLVTWEHKLGGGWKAGVVLPYPAVATSGFSQLSLSASSSGDTEVIALGSDGTPYIMAYLPQHFCNEVLDRRIGWQAGVPLPCPPTQNKFTTLAQAPTQSGDLQIVGLDANHAPYLVSALQQSVGWVTGQPLPCPAGQSQFTSIGACTTRNNDFQVYGTGIDNRPYIIAWLQGGTGAWLPGGPHPSPPTQNQFAQLYYGGPSGLSMLLGLGLDGRPYLVSSMDGTGNWQPGEALPLAPQMASYKTLAVGSIYTGDFQVFGLGSNNKAYVASYLPNASTAWLAGSALPTPAGQSQFSSISFGTNGISDGEVCGLGVDGKPYLISYLANNSTAGWQTGICMNIG
jgi:hypothetical protein